MSLAPSLTAPLKAGLSRSTRPVLRIRRGPATPSAPRAAPAPPGPDLICSRSTPAHSFSTHNTKIPLPLHANQFFSPLSATLRRCRTSFSRDFSSSSKNPAPHNPTTTNTMSALKAGDSFPEGVAFTYVPPSPDADFSSCGIPQKLDASADFKNKKVVIVAVPGAFTPTCSVAHVPSFINNADKLKAKGIDQVIVIAFNDAFVMSAWGKANGIKDEFILFASDADAKFSKSIGWTKGERTARYAIVVDHGKVTYAALEEGAGIDVSGAEAVLAKL